LDHWTGPADWKAWPLPVAFAGAWAMLLLVRTRIKKPRHDLDTLDLPLPLVIAIIVATMGPCVIAYIIDHVFFQIGWAIAIAVVYGTLTAHSLYFHTAGEHLFRLKAGVSAVIATVGVSSTLLLFWLLSCALWSSNGLPVHTPRAVPITMLTLMGSGILAWTVGVIIATGRARNLSGYSTEQNLAIDLLTYAGLTVVLGVLPALLAGHLRHVPHNNVLLWVLIVSAVFLDWQAVKFLKETYDAVNHMIEEKEVIKPLLIEGEPLPGRQDLQIHDQRIRNHFTMLKAGILLALAVSVIWVLTAAI
ncbi:MAG TPA: hypothetical protein VH593_22880, partial [Ktedonobacteraceae bacterium]